MVERTRSSLGYGEYAFAPGTQALHGVAQPLADAARCAQQANDIYSQEHQAALAVLNGADVASQSEIQQEPSLSGKCRHLRFVAEAAERAEAELRQENVELREQVADLAFMLSQTAERRLHSAA
jgi:hypothetical protein